MKRKLTFLQKIGLASKPKRGRPEKTEQVKLVWTFPTSGRLVGKVKKTKYPLTKREKKLSFATLGGAGAGYVVGGLVGGLGGMIVGVPVGTFAGNLIGQKTLPQKGRKPYQKSSYFKKLFTTREDIIQQRRNVNAIERARLKTYKR